MSEIPGWCEWRRGGSAVLAVAPHGGRRPPIDPEAPPPRLRVNDVKTPEVVRLLAAALDAGTIINTAQDRNTLDLNRTTQVLRRAPWFLDLLIQQIEHILTQHPSAELLFIHGWNTGQVKCDIGIGGVETAAGIQVPDGAGLTVRDAYLRDRVQALRAACARLGITASLGERYPASHPNNLVQLFADVRTAVDDPRVRRLRSWAAEGRANAVQLELSIPLRWPGVWRERFVDAIREAFAAAPGSRSEAVPPAGETGNSRRGTLASTGIRAASATPPEEGASERPSRTAFRAESLQLYDPAADIGVLAGVGPIGTKTLGGRLLLFLGGQRVALFTGEGPHAGNGVSPLCIEREGTGLRLDFAGPLLLLDDGAEYLDLEAGFAASRLGHVELALVMELQHAPATATTMEFGSVRGTAVVDGRTVSLATSGFASAASLRASAPRVQAMMAADFGSHAIVSRGATGDAEVASAAQFGPHGVSSLTGARIAVTANGNVHHPDVFELVADGVPLVRGEPLTRMSILRPAGKGYLRVSFGIARYSQQGDTGYGLFEYARPVGGR